MRTLAPLALALALAVIVPTSAGDGQVSASAGRFSRSEECPGGGGYSYALYLPRGYDTSRAWPVVVCLDPGARGAVPVDLLRPVADELGLVVAGSNDCRNGPWPPQERAMKALWKELERRFRPPPRSSVAVGFSGGARAALHLALSRPEAFGAVLSCGAFDSERDALPKDPGMAFCLVAGTDDFNYAEMTRALRNLEARGAPCGFLTFDGGHRWPPADLLAQAMTGLRGALLAGTGDVGATAVLAEELRSGWEATPTSDPAREFRRCLFLASMFPGTPQARSSAARAAELERAEPVSAELAREDRAIGLWERIQRAKDLVALREVLADLKEREAQGGAEALHARRLTEMVAQQLAWRGPQALEGGRQREALECMATAVELRPGDPLLAYNAACVFARVGRRDEALAYLRRAASLGFKRSDLAREDPDLKKVHGDPAFEEILGLMR